MGKFIYIIVIHRKNNYNNGLEIDGKCVVATVNRCWEFRKYVLEFV